MEFRKKILFGKSKKEVLMSARQDVRGEDLTSGCPAAFGYLAVLPEVVPIPQGCYYCHKLINCRSNKKK